MIGVYEMLAIGCLVGCCLGLIFAFTRVGCFSLAIVPISAIIYVDWWQGQNSDRLNSTSGLEYLFLPPVPLASALFAYGCVWLIKDWRRTRD